MTYDLNIALDRDLEFGVINCAALLECSHESGLRAECVGLYLRVSLEVILVKRLEVALVRACGRGLASWWDRVGEVGGAE